MTVVSSGSKRFQVDFVASGIDHGFEIWDQFGEVLEAAGWTPIDYNDGSSVITSGTRGNTTEMDNTNAWQRMQAPAGTFEVVWQRGTSERTWRAFFAQDGYNADGTITTIPTEVSGVEFQFVGLSGSLDTDWTGITTNDRRWNMCADTVPGQAGFYYFHMFSNFTATGLEGDRFVFCPYETGTFPVENTAPWALIQGTAAVDIKSNTATSIHFKRGLAGDASDTTATLAAQGQYPSFGVTNPWNNKQDFIRCRVADISGADEHQGGDMLDVFWPASPIGILPERATVNLATVWGAGAGADPGALFRFADALLPWPDGVTPTV